MNTTIRFTFALLFAGAFAAGAHAEYRCDPAPSSIDQRACNAAQQGPDSLRRFVERWDSKMPRPRRRGMRRAVTLPTSPRLKIALSSRCRRSASAPERTRRYAVRTTVHRATGRQHDVALAAFSLHGESA